MRANPELLQVISELPAATTFERLFSVGAKTWERNRKKLAFGLNPPDNYLEYLPQISLANFAKIYLQIIEGQMVGDDTTDPKQLIEIIDAFIFKSPEDDRAFAITDKQGLKDSLDSAGIPNQIRLKSSDPVEERKRQQEIEFRKKGERQANALGIRESEYYRLIEQGQRAKEIFTMWGPFYGDSKEPTFRVSAEPLLLGHEYEEQLEVIGESIRALQQALPSVPEEVRKKLGIVTSLTPTPTWRIDAIIDITGKLLLNEIQVADGASALMVAEQLAYGLQEPSASTAAQFANTMKETWSSSGKPVKIAWYYPDDLYLANARSFTKMVNVFSSGQVIMNIISDRNEQPNLVGYDFVINETLKDVSSELSKSSIAPNQCYGSEQSFLGNKALYALLLDTTWENFWIKNMGTDNFYTLREVLPATTIVGTRKELQKAISENKVIKACGTTNNLALLGSGKGVFGPWDYTKYQSAVDLFNQGELLIVQEFIEPAQLPILLLKGKQNLEKVNWYNRICATYVTNPWQDESDVKLTAVEATLGENVVPAKRGCTFTAVSFT